ncbi:hypothetical protein ABFS82_07G094900 [Erythranthe guttata]
MELKLILIVVLFIFSSPGKIESSGLSGGVEAEPPYINVETNDYYERGYLYYLCRSIKCVSSDYPDTCAQYECSICAPDKRCLP